MRFFIGYLIQGPAAAWHREVSDEIAERFGIWKVTEKNPPHVTIYYPFETDDIGSVKDYLRTWLASHRSSGTIEISGFDRFDDRVIFARVGVDRSVEGEILALRRELAVIVPARDALWPDQLAWHPHATLAYKIPPETVRDIWNYVKTLPAPRFEAPFDNVTIFRWHGERWEIEEMLAT